MTHVDDAEYQFCAKILKIYSSDRPLVVAEAENFTFYITFPGERRVCRPTRSGVSDPSPWTPTSRSNLWTTMPTLPTFYKVRVTSIYDRSEQKEVETMMDSERGDCLVRFDSDNLGGELIPRTCQPASRH